MPRRALSSIVLGGLIAGAFDITYAIVFSFWRSGVAPSRVLQSVASGLLGSAAFEGGVPIAVLGLILHFCIALGAAAVYGLASRYLPFLIRRPLLSGLAYGALVYAFMNLVVLPLSRYPPRKTFPLVVIVTGLLVHMFLIGLPIALAARRFGGQQS